MVNSNADINGFPNAMENIWRCGSTQPKTNHRSIEPPRSGARSPKTCFTDTTRAVGKCASKVDDIQQLSDISIKDLLSGKNESIASMVSRMTKTDISFKAFAGVKNELIEVYRETMNSSL